MNLLIDIGNTESIIGVVSDDKVVARWRLSTASAQTPDMVLLHLNSLLNLQGITFDQLSSATLAAVVPKIIHTWVEALACVDIETLVVKHGVDAGLLYNYKDPEEIGADRIANAVGAIETYGAPVIVVDFGTATNIDVIDKDAAYCGGTITPGVGVSSDALFKCAAKLSSTPIKKPEKFVGDTTSSALQSGIVYGAAAQCEGLVARIKDELSIQDAPVIATGGYASLIATATDLFDVVDKNLTLKGLAIISKSYDEKKNCLNEKQK